MGKNEKTNQLNVLGGSIFTRRLCPQHDARISRNEDE
jgi:hypothetical protein